MLNQKQCRKSEVPEPTPDKLGQIPLQSENAAPDVSVAGSLNTNIFYVELCFFSCVCFGLFENKCFKYMNNERTRFFLGFCLSQRSGLRHL